MGQVLRLLGEEDKARARFLESMRMHAEARNLPGIGAALNVMSSLESSAGRHVQALRLKGAAAAVRERTGASAPVLFTRPVDVEGAARLVMSDAAVQEVLAEGRRMTIEEAVEYASGLA